MLPRYPSSREFQLPFVFYRTADNNGFTVLLKISTTSTVADPRSDSPGLHRPLLFVCLFCTRDRFARILLSLISINGSMIFFFPSDLIGSKLLLSHINRTIRTEKLLRFNCRFYLRFYVFLQQCAISYFLLTNFGRYIFTG